MAAFSVVTFDGLNPPLNPLARGNLILISQNGTRGDVIDFNQLIAFLNAELSKPALGALSNVNLTTPTDNQILSYSLETGFWVNRTLILPDALASMVDVVIATPTEHQFLRYGDDNKWHNVTVNIPTALSHLVDIAITTPQNNDKLRYDALSGKWVNYTPIHHYDVGIYQRLKPDAGVIFTEFVLPEAVKYGVNLTGSQASVGVPPDTGNATVSILLNNAPFATLVYEQTTGTSTFTLATETNAAAGSVISFSTNYTGSGLERMRITLRGQKG